MSDLDRELRGTPCAGDNSCLPKPTSTRPWCIAVATIVMAFGARSLHAQNDSANDQIWIAPTKPTANQSGWFPRSIKSRVGKVIAIDAKQVRFVSEGDEAESIFSSDRLIWVEPGSQSAKESAALKLVAEGKHSEAVRALLDVLAERPPVWRQQWLSMVASGAAWKSERATIALEIVSQIDRRPLPAMVLARLPIQWQNRRPSPQAEAAAKSRLADPSPLVQLVAASWLLSSRDRNQAMAAIEKLRADDRPNVARFAEILSWRTATPPRVAENARAWRTKVESLPIPLQTGPTQTLIDKFRSAELVDQAEILQWSLDLIPTEPKL